MYIYIYIVFVMLSIYVYIYILGSLRGQNYTRVRCVAGLLVNFMEHTCFALLTRRCSGQGQRNSQN